MTRPDADGAVDITAFIDKMAETRYRKYDSHASMPNPLSWEQYKAEDPSSAEALYLRDARREAMSALPRLTEAFRNAGWAKP